ncbi:hypothetical protein Pla163_04350 [Planctomycetes bacterium Pla163]|uniref:Uncharacterized protein n=1 Tax=Rohdeia mirabilis TaxID=2528008 RepID=A0A518CVT3_9BACT|nr:hypothetical protein Pla163_04350 [Planctomycetes bacterium Pla163]
MAQFLDSTHGLAPVLSESIEAVLGDWNLQFGSEFRPRAVGGVDQQPSPRCWTLFQLGLIGSERVPFDVWVDEDLVRSLVLAIGFVDLPEVGFEGDSLDAVGEFANLMAGSLNRVLSARDPSLRVTQAAGDAVVRLCVETEVEARMGTEEGSILALFSVDSGTEHEHALVVDLSPRTLSTLAGTVERPDADERVA